MMVNKTTTEEAVVDLQRVQEDSQAQENTRDEKKVTNIEEVKYRN